MEVSTADLARVRAENLRVPQAEFGSLWVAAEQFHDEQVRRQIQDWYGAGVVMTCRWLAQATIRTEAGPWELARSPVSGRAARACPELIEAESLAAEKLAMRHPRPEWLTRRPGWIEAVDATFGWAWRRSGFPPIEISNTARLPERS